MSGAESRLAAAELLHLTIDKRRTLDEAMTLSDSYNELEGPDRGFARAIASAGLRHLGWIDAAVQPFLSRPLAATGVEIRALIRAGAAQIWFLDVAPHAAVNATVDAARLSRGSRSGGSFLNAALRRVSEAPPPATVLAPEAIWPSWLGAAFVDSLGTDGARAGSRSRRDSSECAAKSRSCRPKGRHRTRLPHPFAAHGWALASTATLPCSAFTRSKSSPPAKAGWR